MSNKNEQKTIVKIKTACKRRTTKEREERKKKKIEHSQVQKLYHYV